VTPSTLRIIGSLFYDFLIQLSLWFFMTFIFLFFFDSTNINSRFLLQFLYWLTSGFYFIFSWTRFGKTIGMKAWKLELVRPRNSNYNFFYLRYFLATLSLLFFGLGFLIFILKKKFAHDLVLKSKIIYVQTYGS
jgi:uncharacterized RDD family membrane protein YckC